MRISLLGGGDLDMYGNRAFRKRITQKYRDRPIIILLQTTCFKDKGIFAKTASIFNYHPNLTIFVRDRYSFKLANRYFPL